ncbi:ATP-dependent DNA helicase RecG [Acetobacteraceae bacterium KSS12]|uniref:ATP-dependent DNA helicase RecG n=1 Tax=Rhizosaccharibacter radicis TaxID=2782605 RepID=A0ABT1VXB4_9PROT|nr:ATP-dependent DNA helicase RecG [Acetobacteraceae bacterium KSS12]
MLPGVGPALAPLLARAAGGTRVLDLLFHLPEGSIDRRYRPTLADAEPGRIATLDVGIEVVEPPSRPRQPWRVRVSDGTGHAELVFFSAFQPKKLAAGQPVTVSGLLDGYRGRLSMAHPDHLVPRHLADSIPAVEPVWPLTSGLAARTLGRTIRDALRRLPPLPEWLDPALVRRESWPSFANALRLVHMPAATDTEADRRTAFDRLACDELFADQLALVQAKRANRARPGRVLDGDGALRRVALERFGHAPTDAQERALREIDADMRRPNRMLRLLQGDVGSGKTLVALLAMLRAVEAGAQSCLMAPTEILARQHHATLSRLSPVPVALLTGTVKGSARRDTLRRLADGSVPIAVGTHALFQDGVAFHDLGLAVIDEQHRFGVEQRLLLGDKGAGSDVLVMTATPIPRTVLLTQWGDMQVSRLDGKPAGRQPIRTTLHKIGAEAEILGGLRRALEAGARIFWVCPLVAESEMLDVAAAEARFASLTERFGAIVGLAHGRQEIGLREAALADFAAGRTRILVATTVIEVGVDVPSATVMVIEHAERFGLAQLHQLRGRVGRGAAASFCLLLHDDALAETARRRLSLLRDTEDGFRIAEEDYRIRGGGELMGKRQSGLPAFRLAKSLGAGAALDRMVRIGWQDAERLLDRDPDLDTPRGRAARWLLALFGRDGGLRRLHSG